MKKNIYTITALVAFAITTNAQVGIETEEVSPKAILDFPDTNVDGGILLPYVTDPSATAGEIGGTLAYNATSGEIQLRDNTSWFSLTLAPIDGTKIAKHDMTGLSEQDTEGVVISDVEGTAETAKGVLVLESNNKALALPKVEGVENIQSPKAGMICYDTTRKSLAIFNGEKWILRN